MNITYLNLWHDPKKEMYQLGQDGKAAYDRHDVSLIAEHRGVRVFKVYDRQYDFVFAGACITQRAGCSDALRVIDDILDGKSPVAKVVADHIDSNGERGLSYDQYMDAYNRGEVL